MGRVVEVIWVKSEPEYFCEGCWTATPNQMDPVEQIKLGAQVD
jgi:hypothetical protein